MEEATEIQEKFIKEKYLHKFVQKQLDEHLRKNGTVENFDLKSVEARFNFISIRSKAELQVFMGNGTIKNDKYKEYSANDKKEFQNSEQFKITGNVFVEVFGGNFNHLGELRKLKTMDDLISKELIGNVTAENIMTLGHNILNRTKGIVKLDIASSSLIEKADFDGKVIKVATNDEEVSRDLFADLYNTKNPNLSRLLIKVPASSQWMPIMQAQDKDGEERYIHAMKLFGLDKMPNTITSSDLNIKIPKEILQALAIDDYNTNKLYAFSSAYNKEILNAGHVAQFAINVGTNGSNLIDNSKYRTVAFKNGEPIYYEKAQDDKNRINIDLNILKLNPEYYQKQFSQAALVQEQSSNSKGSQNQKLGPDEQKQWQEQLKQQQSNEQNNNQDNGMNN